MITVPHVFIIESVKFADEQDDRKEGLLLSQILNLAGKASEYRYIRTRKELEVVLEQFSDSGFRYLHLSSHGDASGFGLTLDYVTNREFADMARPYLKGRRLFLSACEVTNQHLAALVLPKSGCFSIAGPDGGVAFGDAAIIWASFYHLMFKKNPDRMKGDEVRDTLGRLGRTFGVAMRYYRSSNIRRGWEGSLIRGGG
jgi:hypothetical protein